jgi:hypothetical protein
MSSKLMLLAASAALSLGVLSSAPPAQAQDRDDVMRHLHYDCDRGDRRACVRFGIMIGENHERHEEWRRTHPDWFWWER